MEPARKAALEGPCRVLLLGLVLAFAASGCSHSLIAGDQLRRGPFDQVVVRTAEARGVAPRGDVNARVLDQPEIRRVLQEAIAEEWSGETIDAYQAALVGLGLWPPDRDLADTFLDVMSQEVLGVYVPKRDTLYLVSDAAPPPFWFRVLSALRGRDLYRESILAHEIVHLLQHQRYPQLVELGGIAERNDDVVGAIQAALEGDATRYGLEAMELGRELPSPELYAKLMQGELESREGNALADAPGIIRLTLAYPYVHGYRLSFDEGWELLEDPPVSTEQVLHPQKRREAFFVMDLGGLRSALPAQCEFVHENTLGELSLSVLFSELGTGANEAAWQGWNGDRYLAARCGDRLEFFWLSEWDSESDALEFAVAYRAIAPAVAERAGHAAAPAARHEGRRVVITTEGLEALVPQLSSAARQQRVASFDELLAWWASR